MPTKLSDPNPPDKQTDVPSGNRCGHDRKAPRTWEHWAGLPTWRTAQHAIGHLLRGPRAQLARVFRAPRWMRRKLRRAVPRSELREAIALVAGCLLGVCDWRNKQMVISRKRIAERTGLSIDRVKAALTAMQQNGWLDGYQPRKRLADGQFAHQVAVRWFTMAFFRLVGAADDIERLHKKSGMTAPRDRPTRAQQFVSRLVAGIAGPDRRTC